VLKLQLDKGDPRSLKIGRRVRQGCCLSPVLFDLYNEYLTQEVLEVKTSQ